MPFARINVLVTLALLIAAMPTASAADAKTAGRAAAGMTPRLVQVRERIDALFRHRNEVPLPPDPRCNPFRPAGSGATVSVPVPTAEPARHEPTAEPVPADVAVLQQAVATLKVNGLFEVAGQFHLVLNTRPYKNGDIVQTHVQGRAVYLRIREISRNSVALVLNNTEMSMRF